MLVVLLAEQDDWMVTPDDAWRTACRRLENSGEGSGDP